MKVMITTTPIRPIPTNFPPIGSLSILNYLRKNTDADVELFDIDARRPAYDAVLAHIAETAPDIVGISAVVSTAYEYTKRLSLDVKRLLPGTLVVVGGNLAASAEILLRKTGADVCVLGEGERVMADLVTAWTARRDVAALAAVPGLAMLDPAGAMINTGYAEPLGKDEIYDVDWRDLERFSLVDMFFDAAHGEDQDRKFFSHDPRAHEPHRIGKKVGNLPASKGCVARCTFCHRWDKGIRYIPVDVFMRRLEEIIERYDVGFLQVTDENFGTDRRWLAEFCARIKPYDVLWKVAGMRVNCVTPETIAMMRDAGCTSIIYGMETGSRRILEIMEKKTSIEANRDAMKWTVEADLWTGVQIILGMPGESPETVRETTEFCAYALTLSPKQNPNDLSVNYAQALPGTPLYEFGRHKGFIGSDLDGEEAYLLKISDKDAHDELTTLNFTDYPDLVCRGWRTRITIEVNYRYVRKFGLDHYRKILLNDGNFFKKPRRDSGYFANPKRLVDTSAMTDTINEIREAHALDDDQRFPGLSSLLRQRKFGLAIICYPLIAYRVRHFLWLLVLLRAVQMQGVAGAAGLLRDALGHFARRALRPKSFAFGYKSLRKIVERDLGPLDADTPEMSPLRRGR